MTVQRPPAAMLRDPRHLLSLGFGSGLAPVAPGTFGTLVAIPLYLPVAGLTLPWYLLLIVVAFAVGVVICGFTARSLGVHDHPAIVWDEVVGYLIAMTAIPLSWQGVCLGFVLFRLFDILKPWPIRWLDRYVKGGLGIMIDDVLAGMFACACLWLLELNGWLPA